MDENVGFRTSFCGFKKKDVLRYVDRLTHEWERERRDLNKQVESANAATQQQADAVSAAQAELEDAKQINERLVSDLRETSAAVDTLRERIAALENELNTSREETRRAEADAEAARRGTADCREVLQKYEAAFGKWDHFDERVAAVVRPYVDEAHRQASSTVTDTSAIIDTLVSKLNELRDCLVQKQKSISADREQTEQQLDQDIRSWADKARDAIGSADQFFR